VTGQTQIRGWEDTPEAIEVTFPGWHVWRSRRGEALAGWCATRLDPSVGVSRTVICDTPEALRIALNYEARLAKARPMPKLVVAGRVIIR
jgi:hypothetical protein